VVAVVVCELSGESSRFRSMVKGSSLELKPRCLSKHGVRVLRLAPLPIACGEGAEAEAARVCGGRGSSSARQETLQHAD